MLNRSIEATHQGKGNLFQLLLLEKLDIYMGGKMNFNLYITTYTKTKLRWTIDININAKTIKLLEGNIFKIWSRQGFLRHDRERDNRKRKFDTSKDG